jgi:ubiquinone/menaquinone biosynthesis C-methylase UbiE
MNKLNIGCGRDVRPDYINLDCAKLPKVDVVHDLNSLPLPFKDTEFDEILCSHIIEHLEYIPLLRDLYRILKKGGRLIIFTTHFTSMTSYVDPTHIKVFTVRTFDYFANDFAHCHYFDFHFETVDSKILFRKGILFYDYLIEPLVNLSGKIQLLYEMTLLSRIFPAIGLKVILTK